MRLLTASYNLCRQSILYSLQLCEKALKASFAAAMACRVSISSAIATLPITRLLVGFTRSTTWVPWGVTNWPLMYARSKALTGAAVSFPFICVSPFIDSQQTLSNFAESLWPGYNFILAE